MKYMTTCCCSCCTVETGTKILSILGAISFTIVFCSSIPNLGGNDDDNNPFNLRGITVSQAVFSAIGALLAVLCMMGAVKKQRMWILPYLVFQGLSTVCIVIISTFLIVSLGAVAATPEGKGDDPNTVDSRTGSSRSAFVPFLISVTVFLVVYTILNLYYFFVILSYYKALEKAECYNQFQMGDRLMSSDEPPSYSPEDKPTQHCP
ncbi:lysosomal-associated transmembrane protein 4A-like isoform X1 [Ornithodoros turicata]|uniref:lysosomal-associated transmembrane protein 4A-like isoform X1 n=1 Tax=Ornithodoros turicata TaxID=34597 RepID=UPI0031391BF4